MNKRMSTSHLPITPSSGAPLLLLLVAGSCGDAGPGDGDPPVACTPRVLGMGRAPGTNELMPGAQRLRAAVSSDGIVWTRLPDTIADQAATPSLVRAPGGPPMLYMTAHQATGVQDGTTVAIGTADGTSWTHCAIERVGFPPGLGGSDPDVVLADDGTYRLYITGGVNGGRIGIHHADSPDGVVWTYGGVSFERSTSILDSMTFRSGATWHQYALDGTSIAMVHGTSADGRTFTFADVSERRLGGAPHVLSQAALVEGAMRLYGFGPLGREIRSFTTDDGSTLVEDPRLLLALEGARAEESGFVKDPAVTGLADGTYLMVYSTVIP
ncbi:MAG: hypothetical protein JNL83_17745 [Myxococcales bacterium]|nr:hypothetical protein [Myxococcales bacterium]